MLAVLLALGSLGALLGGAEARSHAAATPGRLVLGSADAPGLRSRPASPALGAKAVAKAFLPAHLPGVAGAAQAARFGAATTELWSLAYREQSVAAARAQLRTVVGAARRAGLHPGATRVGEGGALIATRSGSAALVVWRRLDAVGEVMFASPRPGVARTIALRYALVADGHMQKLLSSSVWERTLDGIGPHGVPRSVALDLFALAYAPLPGTSRPSGPAGPIEDGTLAAANVLAIWPTLGPEQQAAAAKELGIVSLAHARRTSGARPSGYVDPGDPTFVEQPALEEISKKIQTAYTAHLGALGFDVVVGTSQMGSGYGEALPLDEAGNVSDTPKVCRIRLEPGSKVLNTAERDNTIAHELFHCFQMKIMGPLNVVAEAKTRPWLIEGLATWAAWNVKPLPWSSVKNWLDKPYVPSVGKVLFARSYDAVGFFGHAEEEAGDLWPLVKGMLLAPGNEASYAAAGGYSPQFVNSWGSSTFTKPDLGPDWTFTKSVSPPSSFTAAATPIVGDDLVTAGVHAFQRYTLDVAAMRQIDPKALLVHIVRQRGWARLANADFDLTNVTNDWFWLGPGDAECPAGTEGQPPPATPLHSDASLALTGGQNGAQVSIKVVSLDEYCKEKQEPPDKPSGGSGGGGGGGGCDDCGSSNGDPHLHTFDGVFYDFQGAGEYTLVRSRSGDLEVQAREQPFPGSHDVSVNTAIAMRVGGVRLEVARGDPLVVRMNRLGLAVSGKGRALPGGGRVRLVARQVEVTWPDGTLVRVWSVGSWGVAVLVRPSAARRGTLAGLLGNFDGNPDDDFAVRSGHHLDPLATPRSHRLLYAALGDSWRVTQGGSLFTYARGQSTRTFTIRSFPKRLANAAVVPARDRAAALRLCRALHIRNPQVFQSCLLDVGLTGNGAFATSAAQLERTTGGFARPGRRTKPTRPTKPAKPARPATAAKGATAWARLSGTAAGPISATPAGGRIIVAYRSGTGSAEALTFTPSTAHDAAGVTRTTITSGWGSIGDPLLLGRAGGGLQVLLTGIHGGNGDPLNGVSFAPRNPNGSFGPPTPATQSTYAEFVTGGAVIAPDGAPLWAADRGGTLWLWRGATASTGADLSAASGGQVTAASVGRDRSGRYWLAWDTAFSAQPQRVGLYLAQFDPVTLQPIGAPQQAPASGARGYGHLALACAAACRLVYLQPHKLGGARVVSWAAGERTPTTIADFGVGHGPGEPAAAYTARGRLWVAWWDNTGRSDFGFRAVLGDGRGAGGTPFSLGRPGNSTNSAVIAAPSGERLVAITIGGTAQPYVDVVAGR